MVKILDSILEEKQCKYNWKVCFMRLDYKFTVDKIDFVCVELIPIETDNSLAFPSKYKLGSWK